MPSLDWFPAELARALRVRELAANEPLFHQGEPAAALYLVEAGRLRLVRRTVDDRLVNLHTAGAGEMFAEAALFSDRYHCDAIAAVPSRVRVIPKATLRAALHADIDFFEAFTARLARQLQAVRVRLELRNVRSARQRMLQYLALSAGPDGRTVTLDGPLQDMAADLGLTREAFYRTLAALEAQGALVRGKHEIVLPKSSSA